MKTQLTEGGAFNTLAQTGTRRGKKSHEEDCIIVSGKGADAQKTEVLLNRARRKHITQVLCRNLMDIAKQQENKKLFKSLLNSYYCLDRLHLGQERLYGKYCKNRICTVCLCIRKADIINRYLPVLQQWEQPYFVTLTIKAVPAYRLRDHIRSMIKEFARIVDKCKKLSRRQSGQNALQGLRTLECNFNPATRTYNPHFHLIVQDREMAEIIVSEWVQRGKKKGRITRQAQNLKPVNNPEKCLIEIVKYGSKIFTEPDVMKKSNAGGGGHIYLKALYRILNAMQGLRLFDRFGFNLPKSSTAKMTQSRVLRQYTEFLYDPTRKDWAETNYGITLTDYKPAPRLVYTLENCLNVEVA